MVVGVGGSEVVDRVPEALEGPAREFAVVGGDGWSWCDGIGSCTRNGRRGGVCWPQGDGRGLVGNYSGVAFGVNRLDHVVIGLVGISGSIGKRKGGTVGRLAQQVIRSAGDGGTGNKIIGSGKGGGLWGHPVEGDGVRTASGG